MKDNFLLGCKFLDTLCPIIGVEGDRVRRVVIDVPYNGLVTVYAELLGTEELLKVNLQGAQIQITGEEQGR